MRLAYEIRFRNGDVHIVGKSSFRRYARKATFVYDGPKAVKQIELPQECRQRYSGPMPYAEEPHLTVKGKHANMELANRSTKFGNTPDPVMRAMILRDIVELFA